jgi:Ni,Fe-hydrogenase III small subunit
MIVLDARRVTVLILIGAIAALVSLQAKATTSATPTPSIVVK